MKEKLKNKKLNKFLSIFDYKYFFFDFVKITGIIPIILMFRLKIIKATKQSTIYHKSSGIIICNHVGFYDPLIMLNTFWHRRISFVALDVFFNTKFKNMLFRGFGCVPVNRDNISMKTFKNATNVLNRGHLLCLFPEGHIVSGGELGTFKSGAIMMAIKAKTPIIPVYIVKRSSKLHRQLVIVGDKINPFDYISNEVPSIDDINKLTILLHDKEKKLEEIGKTYE